MLLRMNTADNGWALLYEDAELRPGAVIRYLDDRDRPRYMVVLAREGRKLYGRRIRADYADTGTVVATNLDGATQVGAVSHLLISFRNHKPVDGRREVD